MAAHHPPAEYPRVAQAARSVRTRKVCCDPVRHVHRHEGLDPKLRERPVHALGVPVHRPLQLRRHDQGLREPAVGERVVHGSKHRAQYLRGFARVAVESLDHRIVPAAVGLVAVTVGQHDDHLAAHTADPAVDVEVQHPMPRTDPDRKGREAVPGAARRAAQRAERTGGGATCSQRRRRRAHPRGAEQVGPVRVEEEDVIEGDRGGQQDQQVQSGQPRHPPRDRARIGPRDSPPTPDHEGERRCRHGHDENHEWSSGERHRHVNGAARLRVPWEVITVTT